MGSAVREENDQSLEEAMRFKAAQAANQQSMAMNGDSAMLLAASRGNAALSSLVASSMRIGRRRRIADGRACAAAFVQDSKTYTDCTTIKAPDNSDTGKEWCYADGNKGTPNWGFCAPPVNYDDLRNQMKKQLKRWIDDTRNMMSSLQNSVTSCEKTHRTVAEVKIKHGETDGRLNQVETVVDKVKRNVEVLLQSDLQKGEVTKKQTAIQKDMEQMKKKDLSESAFNCDGLLGYETEPDGDGVVASYWSNEMFRGAPKQEIVNNVDFDWGDDAPKKGIKPSTFTGRFEGYLKAPVTGEYTLITKMDDGARVYINKQLIINDRMPTPAPAGTSEVQQTAYYIEAMKKLYKNKASVCVGATCSNPANGDPNAKADRMESAKIKLRGGQKYQLKVETWHSAHSSFDESAGAYAHLSWNNEKLGEQIIKQSYLYTKHAPPQLKMSSYDAAQCSLSYMREGDYVFKDNLIYRMSDLPMQFIGLPQLRSRPDTVKAITFEINSPAIVYVAVDGYDANPLTPDWIDTLERFSVLKVSIDNTRNAKEAKEESKKSSPPQASESVPFHIYMKKFNAGKVKVPIETAIEGKAFKLTIFTGGDVGLNTAPLSCGGATINLSWTQGDYYDSCSASSTVSEVYRCDFGFAGKQADSPYSMWASQNEGVGSWVEVKFKKSIQVTSLRYRNRDNPLERNQEFELMFSDGSSQRVNLKNLDRQQEIQINPVITKTIRAIVRNVFGTINNGGSFEYWGVPCEDPPQKPRDPNDFLIPLELSCDDSLTGSRELKQKEPRVNDKIPIACPANCDEATSPVYGNHIYADASSLCRAAIHEGLVKKPGGSVVAVILEGQSEYQSANSFSINSKIKSTPSELSVKFEVFQPNGAGEKLTPGTKVDVLDKFGNKNSWIPGSIVKIDTRPDGAQQVTVNFDGYDDKYNEKLVWPNPERITYCGQKIKDRSCPKGDTGDSKSIRINFQSKDLKSAVKGYLMDKGELFGDRGNGFSYGWSRDIRANGRSRQMNPDKVLDSLILFPPAEKSQWCQKSNPVVSCAPAEWSLAVVNGKYKVKVTVGDPKYKAGYNIQINGKKFINEKVLRENQFDTVAGDVDVPDGYVRVTADCFNNCEAVWSRISAIEVEPVVKAPVAGNGASGGKTGGPYAKPTKELGCGGSYQGGRCEDGSNSENCIYDDMSQVVKCTGSLVVVSVPKSHPCIDQRSKAKCVKKAYVKKEECTLHCPLQCITVPGTGEFKCAAKA
eukprot:GILJ01015707.1.p1 GENE.GILJ01015707.1~~GILJ01015707.1.p1  ORF type:complete len:1281 (+),score=234.65 GILJ01015707.1:129-3845(+)